MSNTQKEMWELRNSFYKWLAAYVKEQSREVKEFRPLSDEYGKHKKGKIIGFVDNDTQASQIKGEIQGKLSDTNAKLQALGYSTGLSVMPIKVKTEIINPFGNVALTEGAAQCRISLEGKVIRQEIRAYIDYLKAQESPDIEEINMSEAFYRNIKDNEVYIRAADSGTSYRVSYYSQLDGLRKQQSVGDVLLIVGEDVSLVEAPRRKERSDKAEQLGTYYKQLSGTDAMIMYRVYDFDQRYIKRRTQRLDNK